MVNPVALSASTAQIIMYKYNFTLGRTRASRLGKEIQESIAYFVIPQRKKAITGSLGYAERTQGRI